MTLKEYAIAGAVVVVLVSGGSYAVGFHKGAVHEKQAEAVRAAKIAEDRRKATVKVETKAADVTAAVSAKATRQAEKVRTVTKEIVRDVPIYLPADVVTRYVIPNGFVRLYDASTTGDNTSLSAGPLRSDSEPSSVAIDEATRVAVENNGQCLEWRTEVIGWHEWYRAQSVIYNSAAAAKDTQ